jgi:hypothetical protein
MFTFFEVLYLMMYFMTLIGFFSFSISHLDSSLENDEIYINSVDKYLSVLDEFLYDDLLDQVNRFYKFDKDNESIMVYVDNSEVSMCQILLLNDLFPDNDKIAISIDVNDQHILKLCEELNLKYYNKLEEFTNSKYDNLKDFMIEYCELCDIKYCFMNIDNNKLMSIIFDGLFNNNYTENINNIHFCNENNIQIYNIFSNPKIYSSYINLWDHMFGNLENNYSDNYFYHQDLVNDNWRTNLMLTYNQLKNDDDQLSNKIIDLYDNIQCKYGVIIKLDTNNLPYWLWENIFSQYCDDLNLNVEKHVIQTLYFTITKNKKDDGELLLDWRYNYNNGVFVLYNHTELQNVLNNCEETDISEFNVINSLESFLNGNILYVVLEESENNTLEYYKINLNLDDTNNEDIFKNFTYSKSKVNTVLKNVN